MNANGSPIANSKAVIFDMDGVLLDSVQLGLDARRQLLAAYGVDLDAVPDAQHEGHRAASTKMLLAAVQQHTGITIDPAQFAAQMQASLKQYLIQAGLAADPDLLRFLQQLQGCGIICAIATSSLRRSVDIKLAALGISHYFSVIVTGNDTKEHKPHPDVYSKAVQKLGLTPSECIVIEDSITGVQAGVAAGCRVVGFTRYNPTNASLPGTIATIRRWQEASTALLTRLNISA